MLKGLVIDKLSTLDTRKTKLYPTYQEAHTAAEQLCKRTMGDRGTIEVEDVTDVSRAASAMGKKGGSSKSSAKSTASRANGKLGGRPKKIVE